VPGRPEITAWRPRVEGVTEVFHARFTDHAYPMHTHHAWTVLLIDDGAVRFALDRHEHGALRSHVTLLPPHVPHDGRAATPHGFRKRVLYLDETVLPGGLIGAAVDHPELPDTLLRRRIHQLHETLARPGEELQAAGRLALVVERLGRHLGGLDPAPVPRRDRGLAVRLRELLDARVPDGVSLAAAAEVLAAPPARLVRAFSREYGLPPHRYLTGRRVDLARRLLLAGMPAAEVAGAAGFYDQSHLTRHFRRMLGTGPAHYATAARMPGSRT
jgi:AraC-like DNA-binding protein